MTSSPPTPMRTLIARLGVFALAVTGLAIIPSTIASAQPVTVTNATELAEAFDDGDDVVLGADIAIGATGPDIAVADGADIALDLNGWTLDITNDGDDPALGVPENTGLTIDDTAGSGELHATAEGRGAGIGSGGDSEVGDITIDSGSITADSIAGAGIGSGSDGDGGTITINDGTITATTFTTSAAIGSGANGEGGDITITGGIIEATSGNGTGIGTAPSGWANIDGGTIVIDDGNITAEGGGNGAGIGTGRYGKGSIITINGGTIEATSTGGAGIGTGPSGTGGDITINGGTIDATSDSNSSGIGTGLAADGGTITITNGDITATSTGHGAGIGTGKDSDGGTITITSGTIEATAEGRGAGIGSGGDSEGGDITIGSDAVVEASGDDGPAVGPGVDGDDFGSLSNAGTLILPAGNHIEVPDGIVVANSGLIEGDGELRGDGEIDNSGAIWHTMSVDVDVTDHDYELDFDPNGGTGGPTGTIRVYAETLADAGFTVPSDEPTLAGSTFTGWFDAPAGGDGPLDETSVLSDESADRDAPIPVTWYADWFGPQIDTTDLPDGQVDEDYDAGLDGSGGAGDLTWAIAGGALPDGLDLDPETGAITGTPTEDGTFNFTVTATDEDGNTANADLSITIAPVDEEPPGNGEEPPGDGEEPPADGNGEEPPADGEEPPADGNGEQPPAGGGAPPADGHGAQPPAGGQPPATGQPTTGGPLPRTGAPIAPMTAGGLAAIALGGLLIGARRRRHGLT